MTLKTAALLALVGMIFLTVVVSVELVVNVAGWIHGVVAVVRLLISLIYLLASLTATVFFWVFYKTQP